MMAIQWPPHADPIQFLSAAQNTEHLIAEPDS